MCYNRRYGVWDFAAWSIPWAYLPALEGVDGFRPITTTTTAISTLRPPSVCVVHPIPHRAVWHGIPQVAAGLFG